MEGQTRKKGRFERRFSDQELLVIVKEVALVGHPADPSEISQGEYDRSRSLAGRANTPRAYRIVQRLRTSWPRIVELALSGKGADQDLGTRRVLRLRDDLSSDEISHYLQMVSRHLGDEPMTLGAHDEGRRSLIEADNLKYLHGGGLAQRIPTGQLVVRKAGSWVQALKEAGLEAPPPGRPKDYPAERALDDFISDFGFLPVRRTLEDYQRQRGLATAGLKNVGFNKWRREQMDTGLASRHGDIRPLPRGSQPQLDPAKITPAPPGFEPRRERNLTLEKVKADIAKALDLTGGRSLTMREYQHLSVTQGLVSVKAIQTTGQKNGGLTWGQIRDQVVAERLRRSRG